jgi:hypothetical protein
MVIETITIVTLIAGAGLAFLPETDQVTGDQMWQATTEVARILESTTLITNRGRLYAPG